MDKIEEWIERNGADAARAALAFAMIGAALFLVTWCSGCSSGPQLPITTPVVNISCNWHEGSCPRNMDGGLALEAAAPATQTMGSSCDCLIDRSGAEAQAHTTGNELDDVQVTPTVDTNVSAIP
jgi:hypothetical protein